MSEYADVNVSSQDHDLILPNAPVSARRARTSIIPAQGTPLAECPTNLDITTREGRIRLFNAARPCDIVLPPEGFLRLKVSHWLIYPDTRVDEQTGEVSEFSRTVLITTDGETYSTCSMWAPRAIQEAMSLFGPGEWAAGIEFEIRERRSRRDKRVYHDIRVVG